MLYSLRLSTLLLIFTFLFFFPVSVSAQDAQWICSRYGNLVFAVQKGERKAFQMPEFQFIEVNPDGVITEIESPLEGYDALLEWKADTKLLYDDENTTLVVHTPDEVYIPEGNLKDLFQISLAILGRESIGLMPGEEQILITHTNDRGYSLQLYDYAKGKITDTGIMGSNPRISGENVIYTEVDDENYPTFYKTSTALQEKGDRLFKGKRGANYSVLANGKYLVHNTLDDNDGTLITRLSDTAKVNIVRGYENVFYSERKAKIGIIHKNNVYFHTFEGLNSLKAEQETLDQAKIARLKEKLKQNLAVGNDLEKEFNEMINDIKSAPTVLGIEVLSTTNETLNLYQNPFESASTDAALSKLESSMARNIARDVMNYASSGLDSDLLKQVTIENEGNLKILLQVERLQLPIFTMKKNEKEEIVLVLNEMPLRNPELKTSLPRSVEGQMTTMEHDRYGTLEYASYIITINKDANKREIETFISQFFQGIAIP